jgi:hypothetical protein
MKWIEKVASSLAFAGLFLLGIIFVFDDKLQIPVWLQVAGRMHPLLLHLPITLLLISVISFFIPNEIPEIFTKLAFSPLGAVGMAK